MPVDHKAWYAKNREVLLAKEKARRAKRDPEKRRAYHREWYARTKDTKREYYRSKSRTEYHKNAEKRRQYVKDARQKIRDEFFIEYGNKCACCGEAERAFLTLEHKNRDGKAHRNAVGHSVQSQLRDLKQRGWPKDDYEILCFNCNRATWEQGVCPHRRSLAAE